MAQVFLSYARDDARSAKTLASSIAKAGYSVWWDRELEGGAEYSREIGKALDAAGAVVVLWSKKSVESGWVRDEAAAGRDFGRLVPVRLDAAEPPLGFRQYQSIDLSNWNGRDGPALRTLIRAVAGKIGVLPIPDPPVLPAPRGARSRIKVTRSANLALLLLTAVAASTFWYVTNGRSQSPSIVIVAAADAADRRGSDALARTLSVDIGSLQMAASNAFKLRDPDQGADDADYVVKVATPESGKMVSADLSLLSQRDAQILWANHFEQPQETSANLRLQAATGLSAVLVCLMEASPARGRTLDETGLKLYLRACEKSGDQFDEMPDPGRQRLFQEVVDRFPRFAPALANLALLEANAGAVDAAREHSTKALRLNPRLGKIYMTDRSLLPRSQWRQRQAILARGLKMSPDDAAIHAAMAFELGQVGRRNDAVISARRAVELDPLSPVIRAGYVQILAYAGRTVEAERELEKAEKTWPASAMVADARYAFDLRLGKAANALRIMREDESAAQSVSSAVGSPNPGIELFLQARLNPSPANIDKAINAYSARFRQEPSDGSSMLLSLAIFGKTDQAYVILAHSAMQDSLREATGILFRPYMRGIRNDRRFMPLAARLGLVDYWNATGKWPDFCWDVDLPYNCKREATKYLSPPR